jgi:hypothetical protein
MWWIGESSGMQTWLEHTQNVYFGEVLVVLSIYMYDNLICVRVHIQYTYIIDKMYDLFVRALETSRKAAFDELFCPVAPRFQISFIFTDNEPTMCFSFNAKKFQSNSQILCKEQKQSSIQTFSAVSSMTYALILFSFLTVVIHESGTRWASLGPWLNNTEVYFSSLFVLKITQLQDKWTCSISTKFSATRRLCKYIQIARDTQKNYFQSW